MGWFLTGNSKRKSRSNRGRSRGKTKKTAATQWDKERTITALKWFGIVAGVIGLLLTWKYGEQALLHHASSTGRVFTVDQVELVDCPDWIHTDVRDELKWVAAGHAPRDPLNSDGLAQTAAQLERNPWVKAIDRVERGAHSLKVHATYRRAIALVQLPREPAVKGTFLDTHDVFYPVDAEGVRLPTDARGESDRPYRAIHLPTLRMPVIVGVSTPPPAAGEPWAGDDLRAGLKLTRVMAGQPFARQVIAYDVSGRDQANRVRLVMHTGEKSSVVWGLPPGEEKAIQNKTEVKLRYLTSYYVGKGTPTTPKRPGTLHVPGYVVNLDGPAIVIRDIGAATVQGETHASNIRRTRYHTR